MFQGMRRSRMFGWDGNPLRRRADRLEAGVLAGLIVAFLIGAPFLVMVAGHWAQAAGTRALHEEAAWTQVPAAVQPSAPGQINTSTVPEGTVWRRGRWTAPDGQPRSGWIARQFPRPPPGAPFAVTGACTRDAFGDDRAS